MGPTTATSDAPLSKAQRDALARHVLTFKKYTLTPAFTSDQKSRNSRCEYFQKILPGRLASFSESDVLDLVSNLWAAQIWGNKGYLAQKIATENGLQKLRLNLERLIDASLPIGDRYEQFVSTVAHLGPAAVTEIMCYREPAKCAIWNKQARQALTLLNFGLSISPKKYHITGSEYCVFNSLAGAIGQQLSQAGVPGVDLLLVDFFLYNVAQTGPAKPPEEKSADHDEIRDMIAAIGAMLGFDTDVEVAVAHGAKVDVVWRARIGNLGMVTYVFEVQKSGSIDSLILNLQKARSSPTVQKVIAVSDEEQLRKIELETDGLHSEFRSALAFWKISDVQQVSQSLESAISNISRLGLVPAVSLNSPAQLELGQVVPLAQVCYATASPAP